MTQELEPGVHNESDLIEIATRLACEGYWQDIKQVMEVSRVFRYDEQLWDAMKDEPGRLGYIRLMHAAMKDDIDRLCFLLDRGARVIIEADEKFTALMFACRYNNLDIVHELIEKGADVGIACTDDDGDSALLVACYWDNLEMIYALVSGGADVNLANTYDGNTALMWACEYGPLNLVHELCDKGAHVDTVYTAHNITSPTALTIACNERREDIVRELIDRGADVNTIWAPIEYDQSVLMWAAGHGHVDIICTLCDKGAHINAMIGGSSALLEAIPLVVLELCKRGANVNVVTEYEGYTSLMLIAFAHPHSKGRVEAVRELCKMGSNVNAVSKDGMTALMIASKMGILDIVIELVERVADVNAYTTKERLSPLAFARKAYNEDLVKYLLDHNAVKKPWTLQK